MPEVITDMSEVDTEKPKRVGRMWYQTVDQRAGQATEIDTYDGGSGTDVTTTRPVNKAARLIAWLKWRHRCADEELARAEKQEKRLLEEKEALVTEIENQTFRIHNFGQKIKALNIKEPHSEPQIEPHIEPDGARQGCTCPDKARCTCTTDKTEPEPKISKGLQGADKPQPDTPDSMQHSDNLHYVCVMHTKEKPLPLMYLFKFHASVSQSTLDGSDSPSSACALISQLFAVKFKRDPSDFEATVGPITNLPEKVFDQVVASVREGNTSHSSHYQGQMEFLSAENVQELTSHLGSRLLKQVDVDTREPSTLLEPVMQMKENQVLLFTKNHRVVSLCTHKDWLLMFDSHRHIITTETSTKYFGAYLFYAKREESIVKQLFQSYDSFCNLKPFFGQFGVFEI